ncbi:MAG: CotH kinase family protein [Bacteroidales bacterium]|nr:CotH kinase family protein [Bacteroidales bacterium]
MFRIFICLTGLALFSISTSLSQIPELPNLFTGKTPYKYFSGSVEPVSGWNLPGFNDASWSNGYKSIGYGDGDDTTLIEKAPSVYLRIPFNLEDKSLFKKANLMVDFDDGFVAYINGNEIARVNLGKWGEFVPHDRLTDRSHEAYFYRYYFSPLCGYYLDTDTLSKYLVNGENILAFQVHNDSLDGSDLSFKVRLIDITNTFYNMYVDQSRYFKQVAIDSTSFPIVVINTNEYGFQTHHIRYKAKMGIIDGQVNKPSDAFSGYNGNISIEIRGKSSKDFPKKSYGLETQDSLGNNLNVSLLGMPPENDWILYGPFADKSQIRNELAFMLGRKTGRYQPRTRYCELIMNGENHGLYVLTEKIKRDANRVDIANLDETDISGNDLTGGYVFTLEYGNLECRDPDVDDILPVQQNYIQGFYDGFLSVLDSPYLTDPVKGYRKYIDEQSLIDYIIINEAIKNCDAYYLSDYAYKDRDDRDGRIKYGPLWDNDLAFGNAYFQNGYLTTGWQFAEPNNVYLQLTKVMRDTSFTRQLADKWYYLRENGFLQIDSLMFYIDSLTHSIFNARVRNYEIWPVIDKILFGQMESYVTHSYEEDIQAMKSFIHNRLAWIDANIPEIFYAMPSGVPDITFANHCFIYPNPFSNEFNVVIMPVEAGTITVEIYDLSGRMIFPSQAFHAEDTRAEIPVTGFALSRLAPGMYAVVVKNNGIVFFQQKIIKK